MELITKYPELAAKTKRVFHAPEKYADFIEIQLCTQNIHEYLRHPPEPQFGKAEALSGIVNLNQNDIWYIIRIFFEDHRDCTEFLLTFNG